MLIKLASPFIRFAAWLVFDINRKMRLRERIVQVLYVFASMIAYVISS